MTETGVVLGGRNGIQFDHQARQTNNWQRKFLQSTVTS